MQPAGRVMQHITLKHDMLNLSIYLHTNCATPRLAFSVQIYKLFFISPYFFAIFLLDNLLFSENY